MGLVLLIWGIVMGLWVVYELIMSYIEFKSKENKK